MGAAMESDGLAQMVSDFAAARALSGCAVEAAADLRYRALTWSGGR